MATITYEPLTGGLREIHADVYAANEAVWMARLLAHNQELISDTFLPRHLANDWYVADGVTIGTSGQLLGQWGRLRRLPGVDITVRVNIATGSYPVDLYAIATPTMITTDWQDASGEEWIVERYSSTDQYDTESVEASTARDWYPMTIRPPVRGEWFYLSLWGQSTTGDSNCDLHCVSALEHRRFEAA